MMPDEQVRCLSYLIAGVWWARNQITGSKDFAPIFPRKADSEESLLDSDFSEKHRSHEGLVLHANVAPKKWDATGLDVTALEADVSKIYYDSRSKKGLK